MILRRIELGLASVHHPTRRHAFSWGTSAGLRSARGLAISPQYWRFGGYPQGTEAAPAATHR
jgi:hypothetical protein